MAETRMEVNEGKPVQPPLAKHDCAVLDLAFAMDCTASMGSYIETARNNIRVIVEEIVACEKSDVRLALVEYRDHPPQDRTFITRVHDFTPSVSTVKTWLDGCSAAGGGDGPESVADALHDMLKLSWRDNSTKICILISDAPPHGLGTSGDGFPNGCPLGLDPMTIVRQLSEKGITLYCVGCEPSINPYKEFFTAIAFITGGQYVPLKGAKALTQIIIGGAQEEISLERWMAEVDEEVEQEMAAGNSIDDDAISKRIEEKLKVKGARGKKLMRNAADLEEASVSSKQLAGCMNMRDVQANFKPSAPEPFAFGMTGGPPPGSAFGRMMGGPPPSAPAFAFGGGGMMAGDAGGVDSYAAVDSSISHSQVGRMVQKSKARHMYK